MKLPIALLSMLLGCTLCEGHGGLHRRQGQGRPPDGAPLGPGMPPIHDTNDPRYLYRNHPDQFVPDPLLLEKHFKATEGVPPSLHEGVTISKLDIGGASAWRLTNFMSDAECDYMYDYVYAFPSKHTILFTSEQMNNAFLSQDRGIQQNTVSL
jgi:hypothetical protein